MTYGTNTLKVKADSLSIVKTKNQQVRHYPGTDLASYVSLGRSPTRISCTLIAESDTERILLEQILHNSTESDLEIGSFYYKKVVTGDVASPVPARADYTTWFIDAEFIALDPIPYDSDTDEPLY